jgi:cystathionine beta-lyase/cystathionine gamma-synthase
MTPIHVSSIYAQQAPGVNKGLDYGRTQNPTRFAFERCVADLEDGKAAFAFASGLAAISTTLELLIEHPALMTHVWLPPEKRAALGIDDGLVRLSVGIEDANDLIGDLDQAMR